MALSARVNVNQTRAPTGRVSSSGTALTLRQRSPRDENANVPTAQQQLLLKSRTTVRKASLSTRLSTSSLVVCSNSENVAPNSARDRRPGNSVGLGSEKPISARDRRSGNSFVPPILSQAAPAAVLGDVTAAFANIARTDSIKEKPNAKVGRVGAPFDAIKAPRVATTSRDAISKVAGSRDHRTPSVKDLVPVNQDPQSVAEYASDIHSLLKRTEGTHLPKATYMDEQPNVNVEMRAILIDWLIDVCRKYKCRSETLFLTVALLDRYLEKRVTERKRLQLVGVATLLCAAKFEEQCPPRVKDLVHVTDKTYTANEVRDMEVTVLTALDFELVQPTALDFLLRLAEANNSTVREQHLAQYLLELTLLRPLQLLHVPCKLAASAVLLAARLHHRSAAWSADAARVAGTGQAELEEIGREMYDMLLQVQSGTAKLRAAQKKFSDCKFSAVSKSEWTWKIHMVRETEPPLSAAAAQVLSATNEPLQSSVVLGEDFVQELREL